LMISRKRYVLSRRRDCHAENSFHYCTRTVTVTVTVTVAVDV
jgi:hypothetical protein